MKLHAMPYAHRAPLCCTLDLLAFLDRSNIGFVCETPVKTVKSANEKAPLLTT